MSATSSASGNAPKTVRSMTGFCSVEGDVGGLRLRLEMKALNHRFLELKVRLPREFSQAEIPLRAFLQARFARGAIEVKAERVQDGAASPTSVRVDTALARQYYEALLAIQHEVKLLDPIRMMDVATLPEVITRGQSETHLEDPWSALESLATEAATRLDAMRETEGEALSSVLSRSLDEIQASIQYLRRRREECSDLLRKRTQEKIRSVFDAYPLASQGAQGLLETRIAQELAILLDRTDIEEELVRFDGHIAHFRKVMREGGPVGRKLDFLLQELGREVNTLGNKAQDLQVGEEVVQVKVKLEQLREQVMNLE